MPKETTPSVAEQADDLTAAYMSGYHDGKRASQAASHSAPEPADDGIHVCPRHDFYIVDDSKAGCPDCNAERAALQSKACASVGALSVKCPHCWQEAGEPCIWPETRTHKRDEPHEARKAAALASPAPSVGEPAAAAHRLIEQYKGVSVSDHAYHDDIMAVCRAVLATPQAAPAVTEGASDGMQWKFECVIDHATGGKLSKASWALETIKSAIDQHVSAVVDDMVADALAAPAAAVPESPAAQTSTPVSQQEKSMTTHHDKVLSSIDEDMRKLAERIAASCAPDDERGEIALVIARHLKLGWPSAATSHDLDVCDAAYQSAISEVAALKTKLAETETKLGIYVDWCDNMNTGPIEHF